MESVVAMPLSVLDRCGHGHGRQVGRVGRINNTGQCCVAANGYLHEKIADTFLERFQKEAEEFGSWRSEGIRKTTLGRCARKGRSSLGPKTDRQAIHGWREGLFGGKRLDRPGLLSGADNLTDINRKTPSLYRVLRFQVSTYSCQTDEAIKTARTISLWAWRIGDHEDTERGKRVARQIGNGYGLYQQSNLDRA